MISLFHNSPSFVWHGSLARWRISVTRADISCEAALEAAQRNDTDTAMDGHVIT